MEKREANKTLASSSPGARHQLESEERATHNTTNKGEEEKVRTTCLDVMGRIETRTY